MLNSQNDVVRLARRFEETNYDLTLRPLGPHRPCHGLQPGHRAGSGRGLADAGATLVLHGRDPERAEEARREFAAAYGEDRAHSVAFDVTDAASVEAGVREAEEKAGPLAILVNNAGIQHRVPLFDLDPTDWDRVVWLASSASDFVNGQTIFVDGGMTVVV